MPEIAAGVQRFPFDLPPDFLTRLGYERAVGAPFQITDELRDQLRCMFGAEDLAAFAASVAARRPRRRVTLFWEPAGDELAWTDGQSAGQGSSITGSGWTGCMAAARSAGPAGSGWSSTRSISA